MNSIDPSIPDLGPLQEELRAIIATGGDPLRALLNQLDQATRQRYRKEPLRHLVSQIASAASKHRDCLGIFFSALDQLDVAVPPETVIRGVLQRDSPAADEDLFYRVIAWYLVPAGKQGGSAKGGRQREHLSLSVPLLDLARRRLADRFPLLGVDVWDCAQEYRSDPGWCMAWDRLCRDVLEHASIGDRKRRAEIAAQYATRICEAQGVAARKLVGLLVFLQEELGRFSGPVMQSLQSAPVGRELSRQASDLLGHQAARPDPTTDGPGAPGEPPPAEQRHPGDQLLEGLPAPAAESVRTICSTLRDLYLEQRRAGDDLAELRRLNEELRGTIARLDTSLRDAGTLQNELRSELTRTAEERDGEARKRRDLEQTCARLGEERNAALAAREKLESELEHAREDYDRLKDRSGQQLGQLREHVLDGLDMDLRDTWELMGRMLEKVVQGQREPPHLVGIWNQLDEILWGALGKTGFPVGGERT